MTNWSVTVEAGGDRPLTREEIVALADAVARHDGVASGIGRTTYGARILVSAPSRDEAASRATECSPRPSRKRACPRGRPRP